MIPCWGGRRYIRKRLRADERERDNSREKSKLRLIRIDEADGIVREEREREFNDRVKAIGGINEEITNLGKDLERYQEEAETDGAAFASAEAEICRHASDLYEVR